MNEPKTVKFVSNVVVEERPLYDKETLRYETYKDFYPVGPSAIPSFDDDIMCEIENVRIVQINKAFPSGRVSTFYVAYSKEVQELLDFPIDVLLADNDRANKWAMELKKENSGLRSRLYRIAAYSFWERVKFLFQGELK